MLDQRLLRDNPEVISEQLGRRGLEVDLTGLQAIARQERDLEEQRSGLQAEGNRIGRDVGQLMRSGGNPNDPEVKTLRERGNHIKQQVAGLEEEEKALDKRLREQLLTLPNLPSPHTPDGKDEGDNVELKRWGDHRPNRFAEGRAREEHWQIAERLGLL
ncbi:MAG: serine--tRNA ligase, partial [bacterium]